MGLANTGAASFKKLAAKLSPPVAFLISSF